MIKHRRGYFTAGMLFLMKQDQQSKMMFKDVAEDEQSIELEMDRQREDDNTINHHADEETQEERRERCPPDRYGESVYIAEEEDPLAVKETLSMLSYSNFTRIKYGNYLNYLQEENLLEISGYLNESVMLMETLKDIKQGWLPKVIIRSMELIMMKNFVQW